MTSTIQEPSRPVRIPVDQVFSMLNHALKQAIEQAGETADAKAFAWDLRKHFEDELIHYRVTVAA